MNRLDLGPRPRILLVRLSAIGDVVVTTPVTRALRKALPEAYLAWVVEEKSADVLLGNAFLDEVIVWPRDSWHRQRHGLQPPETGFCTGAPSPYVCLCPATTWANKHWPEESWARLADALRERLGLHPLLMG